MRIRLSLACFLLGSILACSPYRIVRNQSDNTATWSSYRTYAFLDTARLDNTPRDSYQAAMEQVKQAVGLELRNRGYQPTKDNPDLLVNLGAVVKERTQTRQTTIQEAPFYTGQRRYHWQSQEVPVSNYEEGTVNLHVVDAQKNALIWDIAVSSVLNRHGLSTEQINKAITKVFDKFPRKRE